MLAELALHQEEKRITDEATERELLPVVDLLQADRCCDFLQKVAPLLNAPSLDVAASMFAKHYAYLLVTTVLWTMSVHNKVLPIQIENCQLRCFDEHGRWGPCLQLKDWSGVQLLDPADRDSGRTALLTTLMRDHLAPLWRSLQQVTKIPRMILWENTATYLSWIYKQKMPAELPAELQKQAEEDYHALVFEMDAACFGERIQPFRRLLSGDEGRKTCCQYFRTCNGEVYCQGCPHRRM